tara:strand:+ start:1697 stop:3535 length:1839 start_codon:yes stop_codon:yes gene_type:complete
MPSSEKIVSPGVFTNEINQSFLPAAIGEIGAAVIGPTVKGPALVPTVVTTYSEYQAIFGDSFKSGSNYYRYLTDHTAEQYLKHQGRLTVVRIMDGAYTPATSYIPTGSFQGTLEGGPSGSWGTTDTSLKLTTLADGAIMNSISGSTGGFDNASGGNNVLLSGSKHNLRWQISDRNKNKGTFTLLIRRGDDSHKRKKILESWNNLSLDPNQGNYVSKVIGDQTLTLRGSGTSDPYLQPSGSYPNKSKYVRVETLKSTVDYFDENGDIRDANLTASLPAETSGAFAGGDNGAAGTDALGNIQGVTTGLYNFYENITAQTQGILPGTTAKGKEGYEDALNLLKNQDEYDINMIFLPGILDSVSAHQATITKAIDVAEDRGDCFVVIDPTAYGDALTTATTRAEAQNSNYAAMYYPWIQVPDNIVGTTRWIPPSVVMAGVYAFNDRISHPWFAPAGLNRGGIDTAIQVERKLTHANRDTLYDSNVNPIATFPGQGVCAWGQKTLQKKPSALDRVNVRRLMIKLKKFIASSSRFLVFEQNNPATRKRFLNIVNPFMEQVQSQSGLTAFRVVMDDSNNTADTIDRNILYGQIFVQPTRTAEFIVLDFTVQPTGATFPE